MQLPPLIRHPTRKTLSTIALNPCRKRQLGNPPHWTDVLPLFRFIPQDLILATIFPKVLKIPFYCFFLFQNVYFLQNREIFIGEFLKIIYPYNYFKYNFLNLKNSLMYKHSCPQGGRPIRSPRIETSLASLITVYY